MFDCMNLPTHSTIGRNTGRIAVVTQRIAAYYSNYGGLPECFLEPGESARIIAEKIPSVRGPRLYFTLVEFEKNGRTWRASLYPGEFTKVPKTKRRQYA